MVFHVQTEDSGPGAFTVVTQLFLDGTVLAAERFRYEDLWSLDLDETSRREALRTRMQEQHKQMLRGLTEGRYDARIEPFLGRERAADDTEEVGPAASKIDATLPAALFAAAEALPVAPLVPAARAPSSPPRARAPSHVPPTATTGARTSVLRPPEPSAVELAEVSVEGLVDNLEEWAGPQENLTAPVPRSPPPPPPPQRMPSSQDTIVDARLPAALRAAQERLRKQGTPPQSARPPGSGIIRRVEVRDVRPPASPPPRPPRSRPNIPSNDKTMLEIDPIALKQAMARQRALMEAQKQARTGDIEETRRDPPPKHEVVSEPSLDDVIMSYLKDQD